MDKLLNDGAFILFDDVYWTYSKSEGLKNTDFVKQMSIDEKNTPQVELILKLLVAQRENYSILSVNERWAWVQKIDNRKKIIQSDFESLFIQTSIKSDIKKLLKKIKSKLTK